MSISTECTFRFISVVRGLPVSLQCCQQLGNEKLPEGRRYDSPGTDGLRRMWTIVAINFPVENGAQGVTCYRQ